MLFIFFKLKKTNMYKITLFSLITLFWLNSFSQDTFFSDSIYNKDIKTAELLADNSPFSYPVITLNTKEKLTLSFDDLNMKNKTSDYQYTIIQCDALWHQSNLSFDDYIDGYDENYITDYSTSFNTQVDYVHYKIQIPNDDIKFKLSGNYVIVVYKDDNPDNIVLTKRFYVSENSATINGNIHIPTISMYKQNYQQVDFSVSSNEFSKGNPLNYIRVVISQNNRPRRTKTNLKPRFVKGNQIIYDDPQENLFLGGSEFRFFDTKNIHFAPQEVAKIELKDVYNFYLIPQKEYTKYFFHKEINGKFYIANDNGTNAEDDADYVKVHFYLPRDFPFLKDVYIIGEFNNWKLLPEYKMFYNKKYKMYQATILLKQGYYNYKFALKPPALHSIDGNYSETTNTYSIFVYFHDVLMNYDRLMAAKILSN